MHLSLQKNLYRDLSKYVLYIQFQRDHLGEYTDHVECQLTDFTATYNELVDAHQSQAATYG